MELVSVSVINQNKKAKIERQNASCQFGIALLKEKNRFKYAAFTKGLGFIQRMTGIDSHSLCFQILGLLIFTKIFSCCPWKIP